ncbi:MAG: SDR family oxidoreductase [Pseudomonadales bacterium]|nr:SDR family oxidoreductase [Pseudomonadales bacterium]
MELENKTIIITGASSGIGKAAALLFAHEGAQLILGARRSHELEAISAEIRANGGNATFLAGDVTDEAYSFALVERAIAEFGRLNGAFNNAGIMGENCAIPDMTTENWQCVIETNLSSAFFAAKAQIPALQAQGGGSLVFTSSFVGYTNGGMPGMGAYAASKAGLIGLTQSMASQHAAENIRISSLLPGGTRTAMLGDDPDAETFISNLHPIKRLGTPEEIAQGALFLLSDRSSFMTGSPMIVDGAMSVRLL